MRPRDVIATTAATTTVPLIAGLAWIGSAAATGYLAFLQLQYASSGLIGAENAGGIALGNGIGAAITLFFGGRLILGPSRSLLVSSAVWAGINVAWGTYQISQGVTADIYILALVLAAVAGILSLVALPRTPSQPGERVMGGFGSVLLVLIGVVVLAGVFSVATR